MRRPAIWASWFLLAAFPLAAAEPPGVWFLNAHDTGSDPYVYLSVGGTSEVPPLGPDEVVLGWSWDEAGTPVERYPGRSPVRYRPSGLGEKKPYQWRERSSLVGHPPIGLGPGNELLFLVSNSRMRPNAVRWAEMLDVVEAAYRHSWPGLTMAQRQGELVIGLLGDCPVKSRPVEGRQRGWSPLTLPGHARSSRPGGFYYVAQTRAPVERVGTIEVRRFLRWVERREGCSGDGLDLRLFETPYEEPMRYAYFLIWKDVDVLSADFLDLESKPWLPGVREVADWGRGQRAEQANVGRWPGPLGGDGGSLGRRDLCRDPLVGDLCARDLEIRDRLATSLGPERLPAVQEGCRKLFKTLGVAGDPCADRDVWHSKSGPYLTGYRGELPLAGRRLVSRMNTARSVEWAWLGRNSAEPVAFRLADGTRIRLSLPAAAEPVVDRVAAVETEEAPDPPAVSDAGVFEPVAAGPAAIEPVATGPAAVESIATGPVATEPEAFEPDAPEATLAARDEAPPAWSSQPSTRTPPPVRTPSPASTSASAPAEDTLAQSSPEPDAPSESWWPVHGLREMSWEDPKLLMAAPTLAFVFLAVIFLLRRLAKRPRARTSYVVKVRSSAGQEAAPAPDDEHDLPLLPELPLDLNPEPPLKEGTDELLLDMAGDAGDLPMVAAAPPPAVEEVPAVAEGAPEPESAPAELAPPPPPPVPVSAPAEAPPSTPLAQFRAELNALEATERLDLLRSLDATRRLSQWVRGVVPVFEEVEEGRGVARFESLPIPARREWIDAVDTLRRFMEEFPHQPLSDEGGPAVHRFYADSGLLESELAMKDRLRRLLLAHDGLVHRVVLALQYLLEAFPVEHLDASLRKSYKAALKQRLILAGVSPRLHALIGELAEGLGLRYREVRYYKTEVGQDGCEFLEDAHEAISLSARVGYSAGTQGPAVVRLMELFLADTSTGAPYSGRAAIDGV